MTNGVGGDLFAIYWEAKTGKLYGLNASGWAPKALTIDHLRAKGDTTMPQFGIDSVTVPGAVDGWAKLHERFGRLPWRDALSTRHLLCLARLSQSRKSSTLLAGSRPRS